MTNPTPVDMNRLAEIRMLFTDDTSSLFEDFFAELPNRLDSLHDAVHKRANQDVMESAHSLRGSCSSVGAIYVERWARRIERSANLHDLDHAGTSMLCLEIELARFREWLEAEGLLKAQAV